MSTSNSNYPILQLRVALTASDYERLVKFYCDGLGIEPSANWNNDGGQVRFALLTQTFSPFTGDVL